MSKCILFADLPPWAKLEIERSHYRKELILEEAVQRGARDLERFGSFTPASDRLANAAVASSREHYELLSCFMR